MIMDERLEFADATSVVAGTGTAVLGDVINLGLPRRDIGQGQPMYLVVQIETTLDSADDTGTLTLNLVTADNDALSSNATTILSVPTFTVATGVAGTTVVHALPMNVLYRQYLGISRVIGTQALSAGAVNAFLTLDPHGWRAYPGEGGGS